MVNIQFRIKKYPRGWVVEVQKERCFIFFKKKYWAHVISATGLDDQPWYYKKREYAWDALDLAIKENIAYGEWFGNTLSK